MTDNAMGSYSDPNITPPMGQAAPLGLQHVLAMFASVSYTHLTLPTNREV